MKTPFILLCAVLAALASQPGTAQDSKENSDFKLAVNLYNDGMYDLAAEQLRQFINNFPSTAQAADARFYLGLCQMKLKRFEDARLSFQTFALTYQDNPRAPEAWWNVGDAFVALGNYREAALAFERVKVFHAKSKLVPDALVRSGTHFALSGDKENAYRVLRIVLQDHATSGAAVAARALLGQMYFDDGNFEQAQAELKRVAESNPPADVGAQALLTLGNVQQSTGQSDLAQATYQQVITRYGTTMMAQAAHVNLGKLKSGNGKYVEAIEDFKKALGKADSSTERQALMGIGDAYAALNDGTNAISYYQRLTSRGADPQTPEVLWKIALVGSRTKNYAASNDACNRLLKANAPDIFRRRALVRLALNAQEQGRAQQAIQFYNSYLDQYPDDAATPAVMFRIARSYEDDIRDARKAAQYYELLAARYPRSPLADDAYMGAARTFESAGEFNTARQLYNELINKYPSSDFRPLAVKRVRMIEAFEMKEKDAGLEKLAVLVGEIVEEKEKAALAYKLGEIYFNDLKNYIAAAAQFTKVINSGSTNPRFVDALVLRAKSYEYLSWKDESYRQRAIEAYQTFLKAYPTDTRSEDAALALFWLKATSLASARQAYASTLAHPALRAGNEMQMKLGELLDGADSLREALALYSPIAGETSTPVAEEARFRSLQILLKLGMTDSVIASGTAYLSLYPSSPHSAAVIAILAGIAVKSGDLQHAVELYNRLVDEFSYTSQGEQAQRLLADALMSRGEAERAITLYKELLSRQSADPFSDGSENPTLSLALAKAYQAAGNNADAKKLLVQLVARQSSGEIAAQAYSLLGTIYRGEGALELATNYFRRASNSSSNTSASQYIADLLFESGEYTEAVKQYNQLLSTAKNETERQSYQSKIIIARLRADDIAAADKEIALFAKAHPKAEDVLATFEMERGHYFYRKKDYVSARKSYERVASKYDDTPSAPEAKFWIGKLLEATNKTAEAVKQYNSLIDKHPKAPILQRAFLALGNISYNAEKWDEAIRYYRHVVDDAKPDPEIFPYAMSNLIETYEIAGAFDAALTLTRKYLELYPKAEDNFDKKIKIGILYQRLGFNDQSVMHLQGLLNEAGSELEGEIRYYIAEANYNRGDYQQAILDFLKVPYLVTRKGKIDWTPNSLYMAGQAYEKMGRYDQALAMYQQIVDRPGIDETFKTGARKEIERVKLVLKKSRN